MAGIFWKLARFFSAISVFKNWQTMLSIYFGLNREEFAILRTRKGVNLRIRPKSTVIHVVAKMFLLNGYEVGGLREDAVILDIGWHIGIFSVFASTMNRQSCHVYVYEPITANFDMLKENIRINNLDVVARNVGIAGLSGKRNLYLNDDMAAHSLLDQTTQVEIDTVSLQDVFRQNSIESCVSQDGLRGSEIRNL